MSERIKIVEVDLNRCANRFGVAPCTAIDSEQDVVWLDGNVYTKAADIPSIGTIETITTPNPTRLPDVLKYTQTSGASRLYVGRTQGTFGFMIRPEAAGTVDVRFRGFFGSTVISTVVIRLIYDGSTTQTIPFSSSGLGSDYFESYVLDDYAVFQIGFNFDAEVDLIGSGSVVLFQSFYYGSQRGVSFIRYYERCFNSVATCADRPNYAPETVTARFCSASANMSPSLEAIPNLDSISERPARLALGESIGTRASVTLAFKDSRYPDTGAEGDYYRDTRSYDPATTGTYWGKFRARFPFIQGANARVLRGTVGQSLEQMETRHFIVDTFSGTSSSGNVTIVLKDALKLADGKKAQAPKVSIGVLASDIDASQTSITLTPIGVGSEYPSSGLIAIGGDEIIRYTSRSGDTFNGVTRGVANTGAVEHDAGSRAQVCIEITSLKVTEIIYTLLTDFANVPPEFINLSDWNVEDETYIQRTYTAIIADPTPVNTLINELLEQTASTIWWDDQARLMRFRVLRNVSSDVPLYSDDVIKAGSFSSADQNDKRVSQVWTYYGQINPLEDQSAPNNYSRSVVTVSPESEQNFEGTPSIKRIFSRWIPVLGADAAQRLNLLVLSRYTTPPRLISWALQRNQSLPVPSLANGYRIESWTLQKPTGETDTVPVQVVQVKTDDTGHSVVAEEVLYSQTVAPDDPNIKTLPLETSRNSINLYTLATTEGGFTPPAAGDTYIFRVFSGVVIGSNSTATPAVVVGNQWPSGVTIRLEIASGAFIVGRGGDGGSVPNQNDISSWVLFANNGSAGGDALQANYPIEIQNDGVLGAGAGGGGGAAAETFSNSGEFSGLYSSRGSSGAQFSSQPDAPEPRQAWSGASQFTFAHGGQGGVLGTSGQPGEASVGGSPFGGATRVGQGGAAGRAVVGNNLVTWINEGDIRGAKIN
jgi:hypothetical protein